MHVGGACKCLLFNRIPLFVSECEMCGNQSSDRVGGGDICSWISTDGREIWEARESLDWEIGTSGLGIWGMGIGQGPHQDA